MVIKILFSRIQVSYNLKSMTVNDRVQSERKGRTFDYFKTLPEGRITNMPWIRRRIVDHFSDGPIQQHYQWFQCFIWWSLHIFILPWYKYSADESWQCVISDECLSQCKEAECCWHTESVDSVHHNCGHIGPELKPLHAESNQHFNQDVRGITKWPRIQTLVTAYHRVAMATCSKLQASRFLQHRDVLFAVSNKVQVASYSHPFEIKHERMYLSLVLDLIVVLCYINWQGRTLDLKNPSAIKFSSDVRISILLVLRNVEIICVTRLLFSFFLIRVSALPHASFHCTSLFPVSLLVCFL